MSERIRKVEIIEREYPNRAQNGKVLGVQFTLGTEERPFQWVWFPEFPMIAELLQRKGQYEDERYPGGRGKEMLKDYIVRAINGENIADLNIEFKMPTQRLPYK